jgi:hypothetical protein
MTAGPGDQDDHEQGQPQGGRQGGQPPAWPSAPQPQPGRPPYGQQTPHGQPPPYPQNPYAYPAGAATGWGGQPPPKAMERPVTVRAGLGAYLGALVLGVIASIVTLVNFDEVMAWTADQAGSPFADPELEGMDPERFAELILQIGVIGGIVMTAVELVFVWFAWRGHHWARVVLWVFAGISLMSTMLSLGADAGPLPFVTTVGLFQTMLTLAAVVLLAQKQSHDWYRYRKWQRTTGQG